MLRLFEVHSDRFPSSISATFVTEKSLKAVWVEMLVDEKISNFPILSFRMMRVLMPLEAVPVEHPRRKIYEKGLRRLTHILSGRLVDEVDKVLRERYIDKEVAEAMIGRIKREV